MPARGTRSTERPAAAQTRDKILRAAERLFAKQGFDRVTLRQIARDSDQKNVAAVQYHFGSKDGLLAALVDEHREGIDQDRQRLLDTSERAERAPDLSDLIDVLVVPLAARLDTPSGRAYLRIQAQGLSQESMRPATRTVVQRIGQHLEPLTADGRASHRARFALLLLFHALADRAQQEEAGRARRAERAEFVTALSNSLRGLLVGGADAVVTGSS